MSLRLWLPLNGTLENKGLDTVTITNNNATIDSSGKIGQCYSFNNSKGIGITNAITLGTTFSIACWIKINSYNANWANAFKIYKDVYDCIGLCMNQTSSSTKQLGFHIYKNDGSNTRTSVYDAYYMPLTVNTWYHLCFVVTPSEVKTYQNGVNIRTSSVTKTFPSVSNYILSLGKSSLFAGLDCSMDDFRLYDNVLSETEIKKLSQGLMLHLPLNNNGTILNWTEIGNLLPNSKTMGLGSANVSEGIWRVAGSTTMTKSRVLIKDSPIGECYGFQNSGIQTSNDGSCYGIDSTTYFEPNTEYKISMFARITSGADGYAGYNIYSIGEELGGSHTAIQKNYRTTPLNADGSWTYCWYHFKTNSSETRNIYIGIVTGNVDVTTQMCLVRIDKWNDIMDSTIEYDSSGYGNNAVKNNITYAPDSPKYNVSSVFNGSNSYVKVSDNYWMADGMPETTINLWAKATTWPTNGGRLLSCTESGGFNLEAGNTGYWKFPVCVYTNEGKTSYAYKYDSNEIKIADLIPDDWNMITLIYDKTGTKTYLNGVLNHTYTNTSYGIKFNTNARLFLGCEAATANPSTPYFNGKESDFRIYATALSEKDILSLYNNNAYIDSDGKIYGKIR